MADYPARPESSSRSLDASGSAGELLVHTVSHREVRVVRCGRPGCTPALGQPQAGAGGSDQRVSVGHEGLRSVKP